MCNNNFLGDAGEDFAAKLLMLKGYRILERKYRCKVGEIDIIAEKSDKLFFVEVKTRQTCLLYTSRRRHFLSLYAKDRKK